MISIESEKIVVEYMWQKFEYTYDFLHFEFLDDLLRVISDRY